MFTQDICRVGFSIFPVELEVASLTLWYDANVDFFDRVDVGILALSTTDLLSPNMQLLDLTGTPRYISVYLRSMIWSVVILAATNSDP